MTTVRLSRGLCAVVGEVVRGSHATLDSLFQASGAPGPPPSLSHPSKWKEWLFRAGQDPRHWRRADFGTIAAEGSCRRAKNLKKHFCRPQIRPLPVQKNQRKLVIFWRRFSRVSGGRCIRSPIEEKARRRSLSLWNTMSKICCTRCCAPGLRTSGQRSSLRATLAQARGWISSCPSTSS